MKTGPKKCFHLRVYRKRTRVFEDAEPLHVKKTVHDVDLDVFLTAPIRRAAGAVWLLAQSALEVADLPT